MLKHLKSRKELIFLSFRKSSLTPPLEKSDFVLSSVLRMNSQGKLGKMS